MRFSCEDQSKDAMFRNRAKLDKICGRRSILSVLKKSENFLKLWPLGGARGFELGTCHFICIVMAKAGMSLKKIRRFRQSVAKIWPHFLFGAFFSRVWLAVTAKRDRITPNFFSRFCEAQSEDAISRIWAKSAIGRRWSSVLSVFHKIQNGGKTTQAENDVIGCVGFVSAQGFHRYQVFENRTNGSKVTSRNVSQLWPVGGARGLGAGP